MQLTARELSTVSQTCSSLHELVAPLLWRHIDVYSPGRVAECDPLMRTLQALSLARPCMLAHVRVFEVRGFWYTVYLEVEDQLSRQDLASPAVEMAGILVTAAVRQMVALERFT